MSIRHIETQSENRTNSVQGLKKILSYALRGSEPNRTTTETSNTTTTEADKLQIALAALNEKIARGQLKLGELPPETREALNTFMQNPSAVSEKKAGKLINLLAAAGISVTSLLSPAAAYAQETPVSPITTPAGNTESDNQSPETETNVSEVKVGDTIKITASLVIPRTSYGLDENGQAGAAKFGIVKKGDEYTVTDTAIDEDGKLWFAFDVMENGKKLTVWLEFTGTNGIPNISIEESAPTISETEESENFETIKVFEVTATVANMRTEPTTDSEVVHQVTQGTEMRIIDEEIDEDGYTWYLTIFVEDPEGENDISGWMRGDTGNTKKVQIPSSGTTGTGGPIPETSTMGPTTLSPEESSTTYNIQEVQQEFPEVSIIDSSVYTNPVAFTADGTPKAELVNGTWQKFETYSKAQLKEIPEVRENIEIISTAPEQFLFFNEEGLVYASQVNYESDQAVFSKGESGIFLTYTNEKGESQTVYWMETELRPGWYKEQPEAKGSGVTVWVEVAMFNPRTSDTTEAERFYLVDVVNATKEKLFEDPTAKAFYTNPEIIKAAGDLEFISEEEQNRRYVSGTEIGLDLQTNKLIEMLRPFMDNEGKITLKDGSVWDTTKGVKIRSVEKPGPENYIEHGIRSPIPAKPYFIDEDGSLVLDTVLMTDAYRLPRNIATIISNLITENFGDTYPPDYETSPNSEHVLIYHLTYEKFIDDSGEFILPTVIVHRVPQSEIDNNEAVNPIIKD